MTGAEKDAVWRSLPEGFKRQLRCDYTTAESAHSLDPTNVRIEVHKKFLDMYFGAHNLTASEEETPRETDIDGKFHLGDKVVTTACCPLYGKGWIGTVVQCHDSDVDVAFGLKVIPHVALCDLEHYTEQEPKNGESVDFASSSLQNEISSLSKEDAEELAKCLAELDSAINKFKDSQVDWLAYRMELAKDILRYIISCSTLQEMKANELADYVMTTVDGIVERLKGGNK